MPATAKAHFILLSSFSSSFGVDSDCILHGYIKKLGGPFASAWQTRYARLYPNRLELHYESSSSKPELVLMDHIEEINSELTTFKGEQSILLRTKEGGRVVLTNQVLLLLLLILLLFSIHLINGDVSSHFPLLLSNKGRNRLEGMAPLAANGAQRLSGTAGQHGAQGRQDLRHGLGRQQPSAQPAQQPSGLAKHKRHLRSHRSTRDRTKI